MQRRVSIFLSVLLICSFVLLPTMVGARSVSEPVQPAALAPLGRTPPAHLQKVPQEIVEAFEGGMPLEEFLTLTGDRVPKALEAAMDKEVTVVVEMEMAPLAVEYARSRNQMSAMSQQSYLAQIRSAQAAVEAKMVAMDAKVISRYEKAYNGFLIRVPASRLSDIEALPGVRAIRRAPLHRPALSSSVPLIRATDVWNNLGYDGDGVTIAVIDTGIDYTHAAFGGSGDPADYTGNDRTYITTTPGLSETFPTAKVIGGWDFAGPYYDASGTTVTETVPMPDPDPLDGDGHGTHVSSIAAGFDVPTGSVGSGVAPAAKLYALKVFGEPAGSTNLTVDAIEWAMDPNGDDDMSDHVDVINMSLGSDYGPADPTDPDIIASNNAADLGIVVVAAAGNAGDTSYITGSPAAADKAISVAASTTGFATGPTIVVSGSLSLPVLYQPPAFDNGTGQFTETVTATLYDIGTAVTSTLCVTTGAPVITGQIALIERGDCAFSDKVNNAAALGAVGAIIFNHESGGDSRVTMVGSPVAIPAGFVARSDGLFLQGGHGKEVYVSAADQVTTIPDPYVPADSIAGFSSRGPRGFDSFLKPEITAPGVGIFAASMGTGVNGVSYGGTSMASPHVAGVAALVRQAHPGWTVEQIKAAMMNYAVDMADGSLVPRYGAGRVDAYDATAANTVAIGDPDLVSLSWGFVPVAQDMALTKTVTVRNWYTATKTYSVSWAFSDNEVFTDGVTLDLPDTLMVGADMTATMPVTLNLDAEALLYSFGTLPESHGFVVLTNQAFPTETLRVPFYVVPRPWSALELQTDLAPSPALTSTIYLTHSGPISSSLWAYPAFTYDAEDPGVGNEGDLRMVGMDYGWYSGSYGDFFVPAFNAYGQWHTPQPYFAEFDLYLDVDQDGTDDLVDFNFNYGWFSGGDDNDVWVVVQFDLSTFDLYLGSPYLIYTDYNAGFMEWYLPALWNGLVSDTDMNFTVWSFDYFGNPDGGETRYFDFANSPLALSWTGDPGPAAPNAEVTFNVLGGGAKGVMLVDYNGGPGMGQAYFVPYFYSFMPLLLKNAP